MNTGLRSVQFAADRGQLQRRSAGHRHRLRRDELFGARRHAAAGALCQCCRQLCGAGRSVFRPTTVRNSAIEDATGWTVGTNLCDEQTFPDGGRVTGIAGGEFGYVAQERAIRRMIFQPGNDTAFRFERVESEHGCAAGYGLVSTANSIFFPSNDGFYAFGASGLVPIGAQKVNKWFQANSDTSRFFSIIAFADPYAPRICWAFYNSSGRSISTG
jgi:hypothetical protein